jgi:hypothetical protein
MIRLLVLVCGLLLVVAAEATSYRPGENSHASERQGTAGQASARAAKGTTEPARAVDTWLAIALARPLFAPDRKPVAGSMAADPAIPRLTGIIVSPDGAAAIFQTASNSKSVVARDGDRVGSWELTALTADGVSLRKENEVIVLRPRFAGIEHGAAPTQEPKTVRSRWEVAAPAGVLRARWSNPQLQP